MKSFVLLITVMSTHIWDHHMIRRLLTFFFIFILMSSAAPQSANKANKDAKTWSVEFESARTTYKNFRVESAEEYKKICMLREAMLNKGTQTHQFRLLNGQHIVCFDIDSQKYAVGAKVPRGPARLTKDASNEKIDPADFGMDGTVDKDGNKRTCPPGSFPCYIPSLEMLFQFQKASDIQKKGAPFDTSPAPKTDWPHEYAIAFKMMDNSGLSADFNVWQPTLGQSTEMSLSQLWVTRGSGNDLQTVEVGWQVQPLLFDDSQPHLFIYYTTAAYADGSGGYNLLVPGFVQTNDSVIIGGTLTPVSSYGGNQYQKTFYFYRDVGGAHHWWLSVSGTYVGYYPNTLFDAAGIANGSDRIEFGGEIVDRSTDGQHTSTDMGSGHFPSEGWQKAAFIRKLSYIDSSAQFQKATGLAPIATNSAYYDLNLFSSGDTAWDEYFYFGGPGYSENNPPNAPYNIAPLDGASGISLAPTLQGSTFSDPDSGDYHWKTWWDVRKVSDNSIVWDSDWRTSDLTSTVVPSGFLEYSTQYKWRVRYMDNHGVWSEPVPVATTFTTISQSDTTPPTPNPSTWGTAPYATDTTMISMTATTASDPSGVQYFFHCLTLGGHDSAWQASANYQDAGLSANTMYTYQVMTRDNSPNQNQGSYSTSASATTQPMSDTTPPTPNPSTWGTAPYATGATTISMTATTANDPSGVQYFFHCLTLGGHDSVWQASANYQDAGLSANTMYTYQVMTRDNSPNQNQGSYSTSASATTQPVSDTTPPTPNPSTWGTAPYATGATTISMTATTANDPSGVQYFFHCLTLGGHDSAWQASANYQDAGLSANTMYTYQVMTRDNSPNQNQGNYSTSASATTQLEADLNDDGIVNLFDLQLLAAQWQRHVGDGMTPTWASIGDGSSADKVDMIKDGAINLFDLQVLASQWMTNK